MVAHTGYLIFARPVLEKFLEDGGRKQDEPPDVTIPGG